MLTIYPESEEYKRSSEAGNSRWLSSDALRFILAGFIALSLLLLPLDADWISYFSSEKAGKLPAHEKTLRKGAIRDNDAFSTVLANLRSYWHAIRNTRYLTIIDYSKPSNVKRMYLIDMETGRVERFLVSHGRNSGWAYATEFSNQPESFQSSRGFFVTGRKYLGKHGTALQLHGLEKGTNDNALRRGIVMHGSNYVSMRSVMLNGGRLGRSLGCPAIPAEAAESVINRIKGGSLIYIHAGGTSSAPRRARTSSETQKSKLN
ncbi:MAG: murein L,D-transpeptidase catalytic domain family protein [Syntrophobacteraceae bacterium]